MRLRHSRLRVAAGMLLAGLILAGPRPAAAPQRPSDSVEQFEKARRLRAETARREQSIQAGLARTRRRQALGQLQEDLTRMRESLKALEEKLAAVNPDKELSLELRQQGQQVEKLAKRIHENVKRL